MNGAVSSRVTMSTASAAIVKERSGKIICNPEFNKPYRCMVTYGASWQFENCARALQCFFALIFQPHETGHVLHPVGLEALGKLRRAAEFHTSHAVYATEAAFLDACRDATRELHEYAMAAERVRTLARRVYTRTGIVTWPSCCDHVDS